MELVNLSGDQIVRKGEYTMEMYLIQRGDRNVEMADEVSHCIRNELSPSGANFNCSPPTRMGNPKP